MTYCSPYLADSQSSREYDQLMASFCIEKNSSLSRLSAGADRKRTSRWVNALLAAVVAVSIPLYGSCYAIDGALLDKMQQRRAIVAAPPSRQTLSVRTTDAGSAVLVPRSSQTYPGDVSLRWSHASAIADQTMYIFGGKSGNSNAASDYASACVSLDLSAKFATSSAPWSMACAENAPLVAGHSAIVNPDINMLILFGGTIPDGHNSDTQESTSLHLFSSEIKFWSTPGADAFPLPLVNHSAVFHAVTGDMIVVGGFIRESVNATSALSNSTLRMITDVGKHTLLENPPPGLFTDLASSATPSPAHSSTVLPTSASAASVQQSATTTNGNVGTPASTTNTFGTTTPNLSSTKAASTRSTATSTKSSIKSTKPSSKTTTTTKAAPTKDTFPNEDEDARDMVLEELDRRFAKDSIKEDNQLMSWSNSTLPSEVSGRVGHTASIVNGTSMVVLGGSNGVSLFNMNTVFTYDSLQQTWTRRSTTGAVPASRRSHVASVVNNTLIVIHGGANNDFSAALDDVAVLDTATWQWSAPNVENTPTARYAHSASQAGPYMVIAFGYVLPSTDNIPNNDYGLYILDTSVWSFVEQYDPARSGLTVHYISTKPTGGTIFGLFVASVVGLLVVLIMFYIGCMHYYNKHPQLSDAGETTTMLPTTELRNFGRKLTVKFGTQRHRRNQSKNQRAQNQNALWPASSAAVKLASETEPDKGAKRQMYNTNNGSSTFSLTNMRHLSYVPGAGDDASLRIMFDLSRESSFDYGYLAGAKAGDKNNASIDGSSRSRRIHLDEVELPAGLRNRDPKADNDVPNDADTKVTADTASGKANQRASQESSIEHSSWSRPTTSGSTVSRKSAHISAMLPRIVGSRLTLPAESATALARYRFEELEDMPDTPAISSLSTANGTGDQQHSALQSGIPTTIANLAARDGNGSNLAETLSPPVMPAAVGDMSLAAQPRLSSSSANSAPNSPANPPKSLRDSIDIDVVLAQNQHFYLVNPDD
ncbi:hypothetical protein BX070DRAFT_219489 [Coemansia spiralis]|nr:hypothetical protein BX070DRAFT_219489 [Coemansia spiralis]